MTYSGKQSEKVYTHTCNWITSLHTWNIVNQVDFNSKNKIKKNSRPKNCHRYEQAKEMLLNIQKTKIMASGPITSWQIDGETMETGIDFILGGSKITADDDCSHEIKRHLLLGRKAMTNLDSILKTETLLCWQKSISWKVWFFQESYMDVRVGL